MSGNAKDRRRARRACARVVITVETWMAPVCYTRAELEAAEPPRLVARKTYAYLSSPKLGPLRPFVSG